MNITDIKKLATEGNSPKFFAPDTLKFFKSIIYSDVRKTTKGYLFITSEVFGDNPRHYQIRHIDKYGSINYWGNRWDSLVKAKRYFNSTNCSLLIGYDPHFERRKKLEEKKMYQNISEDRI